LLDYLTQPGLCVFWAAMTGDSAQKSDRATRVSAVVAAHEKMQSELTGPNHRHWT